MGSISGQNISSKIRLQREVLVAQPALDVMDVTPLRHGVPLKARCNGFGISLSLKSPIIHFRGQHVSQARVRPAIEARWMQLPTVDGLTPMA